MRFFVLALLALLISPSLAQNRRTRDPDGVKQPANADLALAMLYEQAKDYKTAANCFASAAKDKEARAQALEGLKRVEVLIQRDKDGQDDRTLRLGEVYMSHHLWSKAEDSFKTALSSETERIRREAERRLRDATREQAPSSLSAILESAKSIAELAALVLALSLLAAYVFVLYRKRSSIHLDPFKGPTEDVAKKIAFALSYARALLQDPSGSPGNPLPLSLTQGLPTFDDELPELEDLELAGAKLPFASIGRVFGTPAVTVSGGYDADTPVGSGYALIHNRGKDKPGLYRWPVRPNSQSDLNDFAYNVLIEAATAHAG